MNQKRVAIVGATGVAGQQFVACLRGHPWYVIDGLAASSASAGKPYGEALRSGSGQLQWWCGDLPERRLLEMEIQDADELAADRYDIIFSAIDKEPALELEPRYAATTPVISTASAFRMEGDVPLLIPGVNSEHAALVQRQREERGWKGFVAPIPNCTTTGLAITLAPIQQVAGIEVVVMTSMQALSGAGRRGGVMAMDIVDNVIPYIPGEEEKVERETQKILGALTNGAVAPAEFAVSGTCTRVAVVDGHTESVLVKTRKPADVEEIVAAMRQFGAGIRDLPSAPQQMIHVHEDPFHPQPRFDRDMEDGMTTVVGRLRPDTALGGVKYVLLSHNTKMGAAKGAVLVAELLQSQNLL